MVCFNFQRWVVRFSGVSLGRPRGATRLVEFVLWLVPRNNRAALPLDAGDFLSLLLLLFAKKLLTLRCLNY